MSEEKKQGLLDQPRPPFQNRGLFSDHFLQARLPEWKEWEVDAAVVSFRTSLQSLYDSKKTILPHLNEAQTELEFVQPVLDLLGYANSYMVQAPTKVGQHTNRPDYALFPDVKTKNKAYQKLDQNDYSLCIGIADAKYWERELDLAKTSDRDTFTNLNPSFQIVAYLIGTKQTWGILTNGRLWRLYSTESHIPLGNFYQIDLVRLLEEASLENLKYFYVLFRKQALLQVEGRSLLDRILEGSEEYAVELEADIKERAYDVVELLCRGFISDSAHEQLTDATLKSIYDNSLTLLYRLLFVFYAEARELLPLTTNASYRENYSLRKLTHDIDEIFKKGYELSASTTQYYHYISSLFHLVNNGDSKLGVSEYNGGLFEPIEHPFLERQAIPDAYLVRAIHQLARITDKKLKREVVVDYNTLSERHLGSIYEGLLEFKPMIAPHNLVVIKDKGRVKYVPANKHPGKKIAYTKDELYLANDKGERKASGSYYTPEYIVNYIVENTLDPLVKEAQEKVKTLKLEVDKAIAKWLKLKEQKQGLEPTEKYDRKIAEESEKLVEPYLAVKVLDPAMGSGHFLARATDFLAEAIATDPSIESPLELTEESELAYYRRRVVESCIYGVDLNPLAVELSKLTLWLTTMAKSKPLSFLNHHLRVGNSLIGARVADLDEVPKMKAKKRVIFDSTRAPVQLGIFAQVFRTKLSNLLQNRALIARLPTETLEDVKQKEKWENDFEHDIDRFRTLADVWASVHFGNKVRWDEYNVLVENLQSPDPDWERLLQADNIQAALALGEENRFFHWELEFPEVFYDEQGDRSENLGFDVVMGNPPYGDILSEVEKETLEAIGYSSGGSGNNDVFRFFCERGLKLIGAGGYEGFIIPNTCLGGPKYKNYRQSISGLGQVQEIFDFRTYRQFEQDVFTQILISRRVRTTSPYEALYKSSIDGGLKNFETNDTVLIPGSEKSWYPRGTILRKTEGKQWFGALRPICQSKDAGINYQRHGVGWQHRQKSKIAEAILYEGIQQDRRDITYIKGEDIGRFIVSPTNLRWVRHNFQDYIGTGESVSINSEWANMCPKIVSRQTGDSIITAVDFDRFHTGRSLHSTIVSDNKYSIHYIAAVLNSTLLTYMYRSISQEVGRAQAQVNLEDVRQLPIRLVNTSTPEKERMQLLEQAKKLYQEYLDDQNWDKVLAFVAERLPTKEDDTPDMEHEQSDVVHDLLAFLAEEMTRLDKEKQSKIKHFLTWLEKDVLKGSVEDQKNKTKIKNFHEGSLEELMSVLKKNKVIPDPCPSSTWDTISGEFSAAMNTLGPLKTRIAMTDKLIDQIVYKLYGLTDDEIAIVEGQSSRKTGA